MPGDNDLRSRERDIKFLHLDHLQREALCDVLNKFLIGSKVHLREIVDAFSSYVVVLVKSYIDSKKSLFDKDLRLCSSIQSNLKKFVDAIFVCSKYAINYSKVFLSQDLLESIRKVSISSGALTVHYINELKYQINIIVYSTLESDHGKVVDYVSNIKDFYLRSLVAVNPVIAKRVCIDHIVRMLDYDSNHTISDIYDTISRYTAYISKNHISHDQVEELVHKYRGVLAYAENGLLHAAKVEIFKMLEGL